MGTHHLTRIVLRWVFTLCLSASVLLAPMSAHALAPPSAFEGEETTDALTSLFEGARRVSIPEGTQFIRYGSKPKKVFLIVRGEAHVEAYDKAGIPIIKEQTPLKAGDIVGEKAVYFNQPYTEDVLAGKDLELLELSAHSFRRLVDANLDARRRLSQIIEERDRRDRLSTLSFLIGSAWENEPGPRPGFASTAGEHGEERHELYNLLDLSEEDMEQKISILRAQEECQVLRQRKRDFKEAYANAVKQLQGITRDSVIPEGRHKGSTHSEMELSAQLLRRKASILWDFIRSRDVAKLDAEECSTLFHTFRDMGARQDMIGLYHQSSAHAFKTSPLIREHLAEAFYKTGQVDQSLEVIEGLMRENYASAHMYVTLGEVYQRHGEDEMRQYEAKKRTDAKVAERARDNALQYLKISVRVLENGFLLDFSYDVGIKLLHARLRMAKILPEFYSGDGVTIAEMVRFAALKAGGFRANKLSIVTTLMQTDIILGLESEMERALAEIFRMVQDESRLDAIRTDIEDLRNLLAEDPAKLSLLENILARLKTPATTENRNEYTANIAEGDEPTKAIFDLGYSYGEIRSNAVFGNISYGGKLHDHVVNQWDIAIARMILNRFGLLQAPDFQRFDRTVDKRLRERFGTSDMEDLMSPAHKEYDDFMAKLLGVMAVGPQDDTRTNVMLDWWLGRGDCRSHAFVKQLLFDVWKSFHINKLLREAYGAFTALQPSRRQKYHSLMKKAQRLQRMHMLVLNTTLEAPIKMKKMYQEERNAQGRRILSDTVNPIEEHTLNVLVTLDENENITDMRAVCAFYQNRYRFGGKKPLGGERYEAGYPLNPEDILTQGRFVAGTIQAVDPETGNAKNVPVYMAPTPYAGGRKKAGIRRNQDECGQVRLRGIPIAGSIHEGNLQSTLESFFDPERNRAIRKFAQLVVAKRPTAEEMREKILAWQMEPTFWLGGTSASIHRGLKIKGELIVQRGEDAVEKLLDLKKRSGLADKDVVLIHYQESYDIAATGTVGSCAVRIMAAPLGTFLDPEIRLKLGMPFNYFVSPDTEPFSHLLFGRNIKIESAYEKSITLHGIYLNPALRGRAWASELLAYQADVFGKYFPGYRITARAGHLFTAWTFLNYYDADLILEDDGPFLSGKAWDSLVRLGLLSTSQLMRLQDRAAHERRGIYLRDVSHRLKNKWAPYGEGHALKGVLRHLEEVASKIGYDKVNALLEQLGGLKIQGIVPTSPRPRTRYTNSLEQQIQQRNAVGLAA